MDELPLWIIAASDPVLLEAAAGLEASPSAGEITRLRRAAAEALAREGADGGDSPRAAELTRIVLHLLDGRRRLASKWADAAGALADPPGAEMASSAAAARWKAARFARVLPAAGIDRVLDLCTGIGGDLRELARHMASIPTVGVELDPLRAWMAQRNAPAARVLTGPVEGDATSPATLAMLPTSLVHLDPARRELTPGHGGRRRFDLDDLIPGPEFIETVARTSAGAAIKLAPGINPADLPSGELEILSEDGRLTQGVLWTGRLATEGHAITRATRLQRKQGLAQGAALPSAVTLAADRPSAHAALRRVTRADEADRRLAPGAIVRTVDPSIERAELLGVVCEAVGGLLTHAGAGLIVTPPDQEPLTGEASAIDHAWCRAFRVLWRGPWQRARVAGALRETAPYVGVRAVEVKTRGRVIDPDTEQIALRPESRTSTDAVVRTVFVQRLHGPNSTIEAIITERLSREHDDPSI